MYPFSLNRHYKYDWGFFFHYTKWINSMSRTGSTKNHLHFDDVKEFSLSELITELKNKNHLFLHLNLLNFLIGFDNWLWESFQAYLGHWKVSLNQYFWESFHPYLGHCCVCFNQWFAESFHFYLGLCCQYSDQIFRYSFQA